MQLLVDAQKIGQSVTRLGRRILDRLDQCVLLFFGSFIRSLLGCGRIFGRLFSSGLCDRCVFGSLCRYRCGSCRIVGSLLRCSLGIRRIGRSLLCSSLL